MESKDMPTVDFYEALNAKKLEMEMLYKHYGIGGFKLEEIARFIVKCLVEMIAVVDLYRHIPKLQKKMQTLEAVRQIYKSHNPDMPWIPEPFETMVETMLMEYVLPAMYDALVD